MIHFVQQIARMQTIKKIVMINKRILTITETKVKGINRIEVDSMYINDNPVYMKPSIIKYYTFNPYNYKNFL